MAYGDAAVIVDEHTHTRLSTAAHSVGARFSAGPFGFVVGVGGGSAGCRGLRL